MNMPAPAKNGCPVRESWNLSIMKYSVCVRFTLQCRHRLSVPSFRPDPVVFENKVSRYYIHVHSLKLVTNSTEPAKFDRVHLHRYTRPRHMDTQVPTWKGIYVMYLVLPTGFSPLIFLCSPPAACNELPSGLPSPKLYPRVAESIPTHVGSSYRVIGLAGCEVCKFVTYVYI